MENSKFFIEFKKNNFNFELSIESLDAYVEYFDLGRVWAKLSGNLKLSSTPINIKKIFDLLNENGIVNLSDFHIRVQNLQHNANEFFELFSQNKGTYCYKGYPSLDFLYLLLKYSLVRNCDDLTDKIPNFSFRNACYIAFGEFTKTIERDPKNADAYYNRGIAYDYIKEYKKAITDYTKAIELDPKYWNPYYSRGLVYKDYYKDYKKALGDFEKSLELNTTDEYWRNEAKKRIEECKNLLR